VVDLAVLSQVLAVVRHDDENRFLRDAGLIDRARNASHQRVGPRHFAVVEIVENPVVLV
jgi:hypothetical protein